MKFQWNWYWDFDILMTRPLPRMHLRMPCVRIQFKSPIMPVVIPKDKQLYCNNSSFITLSVYSYTRGQDIRQKLCFAYFKPFLKVKTQRKKRREGCSVSQSINNMILLLVLIGRTTIFWLALYFVWDLRIINVQVFGEALVPSVE